MCVTNEREVAAWGWGGAVVGTFTIIQADKYREIRSWPLTRSRHALCVWSNVFQFISSFCVHRE